MVLSRRIYGSRQRGLDQLANRYPLRLASGFGVGIYVGDPIPTQPYAVSDANDCW